MPTLNDWDEDKTLADRETQLLAARPWWRKAWDAQADFLARHGLALDVFVLVFGVLFVVMCAALALAFLKS